MDGQDQVTGEGKKIQFICLILNDIFLKVLLLLFKLKFMELGLWT